MLGIPGGAVLVEALFFLRAAVSGAFPCGCKQGKVIFRRECARKRNLLTAHALGQSDGAALHIGLGVEMHIQACGGLPKVKENDRFLAPYHAVEPDRSFDHSILTQLLEEGFGMGRVSRQRRTFLEHQVSKIDRAGAVRDGRLHGDVHDTHILFPVNDLRQPDKSDFTHPASTSSHKDGLPIPWPPPLPAGGCP